MEPVKFKESNRQLDPPGRTEYSLDIGDIKPLHAWTDGSQCISCWRPTWRERLSILVFGRVWLGVLSGGTQPPVSLHGEREFFQTEP
jgi:hypothetical protein